MVQTFGAERGLVARASELRNQEASRLRASVQAFVRGFGLLHDARTPCGQPIPPSHAHALSVLLERERRSTSTRQKELAALLGLDKSSITRLCRRMEEAGHIAQERADADGRARVLSLTAKGIKLARQVEAASENRFERLLAAIPPAERGGVLGALELLNRAIGELVTPEVVE